MATPSGLRKIALIAAVIAFPVIPGIGQTLAEGLPAVPAAPGKYDFQWEVYTVSPASNGKVFYVFEGAFESQQLVAIASLSANGRPEIFPIVSGAAAEDLKASIERFLRAKGIGRTLLSRKSAAIPTSLPPPTGQAPKVAFGSSGTHVLLSRGARVDFSPAGVEVTMPTILPTVPATRIGFAMFDGHIVGRPFGEMGITVNGKSIDWRRQGPVWDGLKEFVLELALANARQAAQIAARASGRPVDAPDYVALVADIARHLN
jgi:hypothetical protein